MSISCHFRDCKALLVTSLTHVSGTTTSVHTFTFIGYVDLLTFTLDVSCVSSRYVVLCACNITIILEDGVTIHSSVIAHFVRRLYEVW